MENFLTGLKVGTAVTGLIGAVIMFYLLLYLLARVNVFFTIVREGTAKAILKFGQFDRFVMVYKGYDFDQNWNIGPIKNGRISLRSKAAGGNYANHEVEEVEARKPKSLAERLSSYFPGGIRWIGFPFIYSIHTYTFRWDSLKQGIDKEKQAITESIEHHVEVLDYLIVQDDVYATVLKAAETEEMVPLDALILLTIRVVNPYKALFRVQEWLEQTINLIKPAIRTYFGQKSYLKLTKKSEGGTVQKPARQSFLAKAQIDEEIEEDYGVRLKHVGFARIDPGSDEAITFVKAAAKKYIAEREREAILVGADAEAKRLDTVYGKVKQLGDTGMEIRTLEAMEKAADGSGNIVLGFPVSTLVENILGQGQRRRQKPRGPDGNPSRPESEKR